MFVQRLHRADSNDALSFKFDRDGILSSIHRTGKVNWYLILSAATIQHRNIYLRQQLDQKSMGKLLFDFRPHVGFYM